MTHRILVGSIIVLLLAGCERHYSEAVVLEKEQIAIQAPTPTPTATASPGGPETVPDVAKSGETETEPEPREMAPDEIAVDGVVMKAALRGTDRDPRASTHEQWIVKVSTTDNRRFNIQIDRARYETLSPGDKVNVTYRLGKYTGNGLVGRPGVGCESHCLPEARLFS